MKKTLSIATLVLALLVIALHTVSAYSPDGTELIFSAKDGIYTKDYVYVDTYSGYPAYRVYEDGYNNYAPYGYNYDYRPRSYFTSYYNYPQYEYYSLSDIKRRYQRQRIANFVDRSAYSRYDINYGASSGEAFCNTQDCYNDETSATNWRYKYTYDPRLDGQGSYEDYYYEPQKDPETGAYNWRF